MVFDALVCLLYFALSLGAVYLPISGKLPTKGLHLLRHLGTGLILSTAFMHLLAPSAEVLNKEFAWANLLCLVGIAFEFSGEVISTKLSGEAHREAPSLLGTHDTKGGSSTSDFTALIALESGVVLHSVIIGLTLALEFHVGLGIAIAFHQLFEGLGVGARLINLDKRKSLIFAFLFAASTPFGIVLGKILSTLLLDHSDAMNKVSSIWDAIASGLLIYTSLVELLAGEFLGAPDLVSAPALDLFLSFTAFVVGLALMSLLAIWV